MAQTILTSRQQSLLKTLFKNPTIASSFYLSGGTALAEYYLHHRYSEDLDFFSEEEIDATAISVYLKSISAKAGIKSVDFQQSFNRNLYFLHFENEVVKTEFTYYPFPQLENPQTIDGLRIDSLIDIAVNKTFTIYQNPRSRDFIDLYLILQTQQWNFADLLKKARIKFDTRIDPIQLGQQLLKVTELADYPRTLIALEPKIWQDYWLKEASKRKIDAIK